MKRVYSMILVFIICLCTMFCVPQASAISSYIGWVKDEAGLPDWAEADELRKIVFKEYARMSKMKSTLDNGVSYFDYGQTTDAWMKVVYYRTVDDNFEIKDRYYMIQVFTNGTSFCSRSDYGDGVSAIVVTEESYAKGEAYTLRDSFVGYCLPGGTSAVDEPYGQQCWDDNRSYQLFKYGYVECDYSITGSVPIEQYVYGSVPPESGTEERYAYAHKGDADENGSVTVTDVVALRQEIVRQ